MGRHSTSRGERLARNVQYQILRGVAAGFNGQVVTHDVDLHPGSYRPARIRASFTEGESGSYCDAIRHLTTIDARIDIGVGPGGGHARALASGAAPSVTIAPFVLLLARWHGESIPRRRL